MRLLALWLASSQMKLRYHYAEAVRRLNVKTFDRIRRGRNLVGRDDGAKRASNHRQMAYVKASYLRQAGRRTTNIALAVQFRVLPSGREGTLGKRKASPAIIYAFSPSN
jgi:hypothetical protein